jgi:uncharacterized protein
LNTLTKTDTEVLLEDKRRRIVSLTITEACNLNCVYCYEHKKTAAVMSIETAKDIVKYEFENSDGFDEVEIDLFGGEPTLYPEIIKELVEWTEAYGFKKPFIFFLQTNGTLVHGDFQDWLLKHKTHVNVGLSLDGTPATHNANRNNSYDLIDVDFFVRNYPVQGVRMTISSESVGRLAEDVIYLHNIGFGRVSASFAYGIDWDQNFIDGVLTDQMKVLCDYYLEHPELKECGILETNISALASKGEKLLKWCGSGVEMISIGVDGKKYPCHAFQPNTNANPIELDSIKYDEIKCFSDPECKACLYEPVCPNCYGINHLKSGDMLKRDKQICGITKLRTNAVAYLRANQIYKGTSRMKPGEMYQTINAIKILNNVV